jgi:hypothetical protein
LQGTRFTWTDTTGEVEYANLAFSGRAGTYRLLFEAASARNESDIMRYDPEAESDRSHLVVSAIKSVAGQVPENEFFDIRLRFRYASWLFGLGSIDVALTSRSADSVTAAQGVLAEAAASLNARFWQNAQPRTDQRDRLLFVGVTGRVFNTLPYYGIQVGSQELAGSAFEGSLFAVALLRRFNSTPYVVDRDTIVAQPTNVFAEFFLRSSRVDFFRMLNFRGGVMLPLARGQRLHSRIVVSVPVGGIEFF